MNILVKFPTRERRSQFTKVHSTMIQLSKHPEQIQYVVSVDEDDPFMTKLEDFDTTKFIHGPRVSKIEACNRDLPEEGWDIVVLASDDMIPREEGWDQIIRDKMQLYFPDLDGCLWFFDGRQERICTMCIMGVQYYDRFGYLYHPDYRSLYCDNEFTEVARAAGKIKFFRQILFEHFHPAHHPHGKWDPLYRLNEAYDKIDKETYELRKSAGFPLKNTQVNPLKITKA